MKIYAVSNLSDQKNKQQLNLGKIIASGGAGDIRICESDKKLVLKIYKNPKELKQYEKKLKAMIGKPPLLEDLEVDGENFAQLSWPVDFLINNRGKFIGYRMAKVSLHESVSLERFLQKKMRKHEGLSDFYGHRIKAAHNLAVIIEALHKRGHHVIDMKPQNCFMHREHMLMTLLDCDGISIQGENGERFPAYQYTEEYIAPEAIKKSPKSLDENQDRFALAVIIFKLMNNGIHPFQAGMGRSQKTIQEMVASKNYAYSLKGPGRLIPNNQSLHEYFPIELREAFDRAFTSDKNRPSATEWRNVLNDLATNKSGKVARCNNKPQEHLDLGEGCGECRVKQTSGILTKNPKKQRNRRTKPIRRPAPSPQPTHNTPVRSSLVGRSHITRNPSYTLSPVIGSLKKRSPVKLWHLLLIASITLVQLSKT